MEEERRTAIKKGEEREGGMERKREKNGWKRVTRREKDGRKED